MANNKGWISLHRQFEEHWLWNEKRVFSKAEAWIDILMTTNHSQQKVVIKNALYTVKRGESLLSLKSWGLRWKWEKSKVRRFLKTLEKDEMITTKNETQTTRLIVCNYDNYQTLGNAKETVVKPIKPIPQANPKPKIEIPSLREFCLYAESKDNDYKLKKSGIVLKYNAWVENKWRNGFNKPIVNWKTTLLNTLVHIPKEWKKTETRL